MNFTEIMAQASNLADKASGKAEEYSGVIGTVKGYILDHFGQNGLYATYLVLGVILVLLISRLAKITFSTVKYLILPSLALAFAASFFFPYSFVVILPITVTFCSLFLLFKG